MTEVEQSRLITDDNCFSYCPSSILSQKCTSVGRGMREMSAESTDMKKKAFRKAFEHNLRLDLVERSLEKDRKKVKALVKRKQVTTSIRTKGSEWSAEGLQSMLSMSSFNSAQSTGRSTGESSVERQLGPYIGGSKQNNHIGVSPGEHQSSHSLLDSGSAINSHRSSVSGDDDRDYDENEEGNEDDDEDDLGRIQDEILDLCLDDAESWQLPFIEIYKTYLLQKTMVFTSGHGDRDRDRDGNRFISQSSPSASPLASRYATPSGSISIPPLVPGQVTWKGKGKQPAEDAHPQSSTADGGSSEGHQDDDIDGGELDRVNTSQVKKKPRKSSHSGVHCVVS
jgi:hypothetical protein